MEDLCVKDICKSLAKNTKGIEKGYGNPYLKLESSCGEDNDNATCIVDLNKVKKQYEIWQESFKGN